MLMKGIAMGFADVMLSAEQCREIAAALRKYEDGEDPEGVETLATAFELAGLVADMQVDTPGAGVVRSQQGVLVVEGGLLGVRDGAG